MAHLANIQSYLLDFSDQELPSIPIILHGRFYKRISREEIKGWSNQPLQPFQKQTTPKPTHHHSTARNMDLGVHMTKVSNTVSRIGVLRQFDSAGQLQTRQTAETNCLFKTFEPLPDLPPSVSQSPHQQEKLDFVKGIKMNYPKARSTSIIKPLFTTFSIRTHSSKSKKGPAPNQLQHRSAKSAPKQQATGISMICYPIESPPCEHSYLVQQGKLGSYVKRFRR